MHPMAHLKTHENAIGRTSKVERLTSKIIMTFDFGRWTLDVIFGTVPHAPYGAPNEA